jgi:hypothetical protein
LVDALDSNSSIERCAGSIPALGTKRELFNRVLFFFGNNSLFIGNFQIILKGPLVSL